MSATPANDPSVALPESRPSRHPRRRPSYTGLDTRHTPILENPISGKFLVLAKDWPSGPLNYYHL